MRPTLPATRLRPGLLAAAVGLCVAPAIAQDIETTARPGAPIRDPLTAWTQALHVLPPGTRVRRLAFAEHILFVFHSAPADPRIRALTLTPLASGGFHVEDDDERDTSLCRADGIEAERIEAALQDVLASRAWRQHAARMSSLILECAEPTLEWVLTPVPAGGFREGQPIPTLSVPFRPGPAPVLPAVERD